MERNEKMYLVLLRHSQAEKCSQEINDEDRRLTYAGRRAMYAVLPRITELLPRGGKIYIRCSPLPRAAETADILAEVLRQTDHGICIDDHGITKAAELALPGIAPVVNSMAEELAQGIFDQNDVLFLVGHDPQMTQLVSHMTGLPIKMNKGAALCVRLDEDSTDLTGSLCWFVRGPEFARWSRLIAMEDTLSSGFERVMKRFDGFLKDPDDPDSVHDLRVSIRTLRSLIYFVKPFQKKSQNTRIQTALRETVIELSRIRELDVMLEEAQNVDVDLSPLASGIMPPRKLDDVLFEKRDAEKKRIIRSFSRRKNISRMKMLEKDISSITWRDSIEKNGIGEEDLMKRAADITASFRKEYEALETADVEETHSVRKKAKRIRYIHSCFESLLGSVPGITDEMKSVQDKLGALCDARVNISMLEEIMHEKNLSEVARWQAGSLLELQKEKERQIMDHISDTAARDSDKL